MKTLKNDILYLIILCIISLTVGLCFGYLAGLTNGKVECERLADMIGCEIPVKDMSYSIPSIKEVRNRGVYIPPFGVNGT